MRLNKSLAIAALYKKFKQLFFDRSYIAAPAELSIVFLIDENPNVASAGLGGVVVGGARLSQSPDGAHGWY
jgi:hypothetical protein